MKRTTGTRACLFGGALLCAGLSESQIITNVTTQFRGDTDIGVYELNPAYPDLEPYEPYIYIENQSFDISGGAELLPFDRQAIGVIPFTTTDNQSDTYVRVRAEQVGLDGRFAVEYQVTAEARSAYSYGYVTSNASLTIGFDVDREWTFTNEVVPFGNQVLAGISVFDVVAGEVILSEEFDPRDNIPTLDDIEATFPAGSYQIIVSAQGRTDSLGENGSISGQFAIVPSPASAVGLCVGSLLATRRRR